MALVSDPTRLEVVKNALEGIADGMAVTVVRTSRSSVVRTALDFSTGLLNPRGELIAQGMCLPAHLGGMPAALEACLERYDGRVYPGDILASNDPYEGGSHLPDIFLFKPMFVGDRIVTYTCAMSHHTDIGGRVAGGNACDSTEIYQEGLRIPPLKLYEQGVPNETLFRLLEKAVRVPDKVLGDVLGNIAALNYGEQEYTKLVQRYGVEDLEQHIDELLDYTEAMTRRVIRSWPDGQWSFTDYIDDDGISPETIAIVVNLTKEGGDIWVDFTGTSPQCKGAINPMFATTKSITYAVLKCALGAMGVDVPNTQGYFRPMHITAPAGTFVNPLPPAPCAARALGYFRAAYAVFGAFAQMLPDKIFACPGGCDLGVVMAGYDRGKRPWKPWLLLDFHVEPAMGARPDKDGLEAQGSSLGNIANIPVEQIEMEQPVRVTEYALAPDTEGAGKFRGGLGMVRGYQYQMDDSMVQVRADRLKQAPYGLWGGQASALTQIQLNPGREDEQRPPSGKFMTSLNKGDVLRVQWSGAGGWGNPLERDPELVLQDAIDEKVTPQRARDVYGVVVDLDRRQVDWDATARVREEYNVIERRTTDRPSTANAYGDAG